MDNNDDKSCDLNNKHTGNDLGEGLAAWLVGWLAGVEIPISEFKYIVSGSVMVNY